MTDLYTDEQRDRIKKTMPDVWADAVHRVWNLSPNSPDVDWDNALWRIDKLTTLQAGAHEMDPIRSMWLFAAMYMVERHADQFHHKLQSEVVYHLIAALICDEWAGRVRELRYAHNRLEEWRNTLRKEED
ncbi:hypothetical protein [uncultured Rothia sp.]|uniref:hypothetical protein n=1 Tax=uncultured Rothia sp. TaxID=316088 RepID=UPI002889A1F9|nr:hypothetical protein [uncultured Rothia sp.]